VRKKQATLSSYFTKTTQSLPSLSLESNTEVRSTGGKDTGKPDVKVTSEKVKEVRRRYPSVLSKGKPPPEGTKEILIGGIYLFEGNKEIHKYN
jgi:hypothetical protein